MTTQEITQKPARAIVAAVQLSSVSDVEFDASLTELRQLAKTLGFEVVGRFTQKRAGFEAGAYFGTGKREELRLMREQEAVDVILIDHEISPSQQFNLAKEVGCEVMDRSMVILEIFRRHASSRYARAGRDRAPGLHGAAPARSRQGGRAEGPGAQRHRRTQRRRVARRARPAQDPRPHRRAAGGARRDGVGAQDAARPAAGARGPRPRGAG